MNIAMGLPSTYEGYCGVSYHTRWSPWGLMAGDTCGLQWSLLAHRSFTVRSAIRYQGQHGVSYNLYRDVAMGLLSHMGLQMGLLLITVMKRTLTKLHIV